jgi:trehalose/maltose hydrolase-like predicted phosphorylase
VQRCFSGLALREGVLWFNPCLPDELEEIRSRIQYRGHWIRFRINHKTLTVSFEGAWEPYARIGFDGKVHTLKRGETREFGLTPKESGT